MSPAEHERGEEPGRRKEDQERATALEIAREARREARNEIRRRGRWWMACWLLTLAFSGLGLWLAGGAGESAKDAASDANSAAKSAQRVAGQAKAQSDQTQYERRRNLRISCEDQNERHKTAIEALDRVLKAAIQKNPAGRARLEASRVSTVLLIDAIAPSRDCDDVVQKAAPGSAATGG